MALVRKNLIQKHSSEFTKADPEIFPTLTSQADDRRVIICE